jgi:hypothetical protein
MRPLLVAGVAVAVWLAPTSAFAQPSEVDALIEQGVELREQRKDDEALKVFTRAFELSHGPRAQAQVALAEQALGRWVQAESDMTAALAATEDMWITRNAAALEKALRTIREHLGDLELRGGVPGGEVLINGAHAGTMPLDRPLRVAAGTCVLEIRTAGYFPLVREVMVTPNGTSREVIDLRPVDSAPTPSGPTPSGPSPVTATAPPHDPRTPIEGPGPRSWTARRTAGWVTVGSAAVFLGGGVLGLVAHDSNATSYNADTSCPGTSSASQAPSCADRESAAKTWQTVSIVGFAGAGALAAVGAVVLLTEPAAGESHAERSFRCVPLLAAGVACTIDF